MSWKCKWFDTLLNGKFNSLARLLPFSIFRGGEKNPAIKVRKVSHSARLARFVETVCACRAAAKEASCISGITKEDLFPDQQLQRAYLWFSGNQGAQRVISSLPLTYLVLDSTTNAQLFTQHKDPHAKPAHRVPEISKLWRMKSIAFCPQ